MALHLQSETLCAMGQIMTSEDPAICLKNDIVNRGNTTGTKQLLETVGLCVIRSFTTLHWMRVYKLFLNPKNNLGNLTQTNPSIMQRTTSF